MPRPAQWTPTMEPSRFPHDAPTLSTGRFIVMPLAPPMLGQLVELLLQDEALARGLAWMEDKSHDGAHQEARILECQYLRGNVMVRGIVEHARSLFVGIVVARQAVHGIELEVLCDSMFANQGIADEVRTPVSEWLNDNVRLPMAVRQ